MTFMLNVVINMKLNLASIIFLGTVASEHPWEQEENNLLIHAKA